MSSTSLPQEISSRLNQLERHVRGLNFLRGAGMVIAVAAGIVGTCLLADYLLALPALARRLLMVAGSVGVVWSAWRFLIQPLLLSFDDTELAAMVETAFPGLQEQLTSTLQLSRDDLPEEHRGSQFMRDQLASNAVRTARPMKFQSAVSSRETGRAILGAAVSLCLLLSPLLLWPAGYRLLLQRLAAKQTLRLASPHL